MENTFKRMHTFPFMRGTGKTATGTSNAPIRMKKRRYIVMDRTSHGELAQITQITREQLISPQSIFSSETIPLHQALISEWQALMPLCKR